MIFVQTHKTLQSLSSLSKENSVNERNWLFAIHGQRGALCFEVLLNVLCWLIPFCLGTSSNVISFPVKRISLVGSMFPLLWWILVVTLRCFPWRKGIKHSCTTFPPTPFIYSVSGGSGVAAVESLLLNIQSVTGPTIQVKLNASQATIPVRRLRFFLHKDDLEPLLQWQRTFHILTKIVKRRKHALVAALLEQYYCSAQIGEVFLGWTKILTLPSSKKQSLLLEGQQIRISRPGKTNFTLLRMNIMGTMITSLSPQTPPVLNWTLKFIINRYRVWE